MGGVPRDSTSAGSEERPAPSSSEIASDGVSAGMFAEFDRSLGATAPGYPRLRSECGRRQILLWQKSRCVRPLHHCSHSTRSGSIMALCGLYHLALRHRLRPAYVTRGMFAASVEAKRLGRSRIPWPSSRSGISMKPSAARSALAALAFDGLSAATPIKCRFNYVRSTPGDAPDRGSNQARYGAQEANLQRRHSPWRLRRMPPASPNSPTSKLQQ